MSDTNRTNHQLGADLWLRAYEYSVWNTFPRMVAAAVPFQWNRIGEIIRYEIITLLYSKVITTKASTRVMKTTTTAMPPEAVLARHRSWLALWAKGCGVVGAVSPSLSFLCVSADASPLRSRCCPSRRPSHLLAGGPGGAAVRRRMLPVRALSTSSAPLLMCAWFGLAWIMFLLRLTCWICRCKRIYK
ncbi:hypothetical protein BJV78DRAFT_1218450 [Lactifluus subvellereus]|nr:hypothetical protein BJV78DRAFT_1218450 [Lactifluus subvellereus]